MVKRTCNEGKRREAKEGEKRRWDPGEVPEEGHRHDVTANRSIQYLRKPDEQIRN